MTRPLALLFLTLVALTTACAGGTLRTASPKEVYESSIQSGVARIIVKNTLTGEVLYERAADHAPFAAYQKPCSPGADSGMCLYKVDDDKENMLFQYALGEEIAVIYVDEPVITYAP